MAYFAHSKENQTEDSWQLLADHLTKTAQLAKEFADRFNAGEYAYIIGLLHDLGKYSREFQQKLRGANLRVTHSTAGAKEAMENYGEAFGKLFAYCIAGHHAGLPDYGYRVEGYGLAARLQDEPEDYSAFHTELTLPPMPGLPQVNLLFKKPGFTFAFLIRMLYSCLTDADFLDTEIALANTPVLRGGYPSIPELTVRLDQYLEELAKSSKGRMKSKRNEIQARCIELAASKPGMYSLTVPTGGGKTISSLAFALKHAKIHELERIIYVIPYTSIIEQNANEFRKILGGESVLEHHSNVQNDLRYSRNNQNKNTARQNNLLNRPDLRQASNKDNWATAEEEASEAGIMQQRMRLATENWDIPVVVTTNVQFFESLFGHKSSRCRKLHNIAKSVIILDEAQMLPREYLKPCLYALSELVTNYGSTVVLCTATQPALQAYLPERIKVQEIMADPVELYQYFRRVEVIKRGTMTDDELVAELKTHHQALCIVNTRKHAVQLYQKLQGEEGVFHLSTLMCPKHRREQLELIRAYLDDKKRCLVISTQLIEAGVDVDFPVVYRSMSGLDSIIQSAGRCNREWKADCGYVHVFTSAEDYAQPIGWLQRTAQIAETVFRHHEDVTSLEAIKMYFEHMYYIEGSKLDKQDIINKLEKQGDNLEFDFTKISDSFQLIPDNTYSIIISYDDEAEDLINEARFSPYPRSALRALQPYTVSIYTYQFTYLSKEGVLEIIDDTLIILKDRDRYHEKTGLLVNDNSKMSGEGFIV